MLNLQCNKCNKWCPNVEHAPSLASSGYYFSYYYAANKESILCLLYYRQVTPSNLVINSFYCGDCYREKAEEQGLMDKDEKPLPLCDFAL